jgi:hypothetical protein
MLRLVPALEPTAPACPHQNPRFTSIRRAFDSRTIRSRLPWLAACFAPDSSTRMNRPSADALSSRSCRRFRYPIQRCQRQCMLSAAQNSCRFRPLASYSVTSPSTSVRLRRRRVPPKCFFFAHVPTSASTCLHKWVARTFTVLHYGLAQLGTEEPR